MVRVAGLDSRACGRLVARGHNSPPVCCSVPLVLQVPLKNKKSAIADAIADFLVRVAGLEPTASWSRTKRDTKLRHTRILMPYDYITIANKNQVVLNNYFNYNGCALYISP